MTEKQQHKNEFIIASTEVGTNLCYNDEMFTLDDEMTRTLLLWCARHEQEKFNKIVCPCCPNGGIPLTPALTAYYTERSQSTGKSISSLVLQDLAALHRKRVAREEKRVWKEIEYERL
jgi:hypothetical protein